jgi:hypothetical protein
VGGIAKRAYLRPHPLGPTPNVLVSNPHEVETLHFRVRVLLYVEQHRGFKPMRAAVQLNQKARRKIAEIVDEVIYRNLAAEIGAQSIFFAYYFPESNFG